MLGGAGEVGRSLSQMLKQTSKLDVLALYDVAALNKRFSSTPVRYHSYSNGEPLNPMVRYLFSFFVMVLSLCFYVVNISFSNHAMQSRLWVR